LPNKLFDYIHAGIPVLASDLVEVKKVVETLKVGEIVPELVPEKLAERIRQMLSDEDKLAQYKANTKNAAEELTWEKESKQVLATLYQGN
jgi:glycosyltransferase involved in cell wall biosynthesis